MRLEVFAEEGWAGRVADEWGERLRAHPGMRMVLPTGATPRPLYREMAVRSPDLRSSMVYVLDEFLGLPPGHVARCDVMMRQDFIDLLDEPPILDALDAEAEDLDAEVARFASAVASGSIDLTLLGLGANGHIALNEPGSTPEDGARVVTLHPATVASMSAVADPPPRLGVTLGVADILRSEAVWLLVTGSGKAEILARAVDGPIGPDVPATYLQNHPDTTVFADEPAARLLRR
jgi:glucosamine-6-phosphate deaminase